jgi:hypothetical protein
MFVVMPIFMAAFGFFIMKKLVWDLIDEVYDEGATLLCNFEEDGLIEGAKMCTVRFK